MPRDVLIECARDGGALENCGGNAGGCVADYINQDAIDDATEGGRCSRGGGKDAEV